MARSLFMAIVAVAAVAVATVLYTKRQIGPRAHPMATMSRMMMAPQGTGTGVSEIGVYSIFTGAYSVLIPEFLGTMRTRFLPEHKKRFYIIVDNAELCDKLVKTEPDIECTVKEHLEWPYATLYRWNFFRTSFTPSEDVSHIFFMNANARCVDTVTDEILGPHVAVLHNMFEDTPYSKMSFEKNPISMAYVPPAEHVRYYGARFLGATRENFLRMCEVLDVNTQIDESNHFIAAWHDESHWNHYVNMVLNERDVKVIGPEYHVPEESMTAPNGLSSIKASPKIVYINKVVHVPKFEDSKSRVWQYTTGGEVRFGHPYMELPAFRADTYRALNPNLADMDDEALRVHYLAHPQNPYFHESPAFATLFDATAYAELYGLDSELFAKYHYIREGVWSEGIGFPVRGCALDRAKDNEDLFLAYDWQKGDRLENQLTARLLEGLSIYSGTPAPTAAPTNSPTTSPTTSPTQAPTAFTPSDEYDRLASDMICAGGIPTPIPQGLSRVLREKEAEDGEESKEADALGLSRGRELAGGYNPSAKACFDACQNYFAPDNAQFFFNLIQDGNTKACQCCKTCPTLIAAPGGVAFANCIPGSSLAIRRTVRPTWTKQGKTTAVKVAVKGTKKAALEGLALAISFPQAYATAGKAVTKPKVGMLMPVQTNGSWVLWPQFNLQKGQTRRFKALFKVAPFTPSGEELAFEVVAFQTVGAQAPYCPRSLSPATVKVRGKPKVAMPAGTVARRTWVSGASGASTAADSDCRIDIRLGRNKKVRPMHRKAGSKLAIKAVVKSSHPVNNGVVEILLPAAFEVIKVATSRKDTPRPRINGQSIVWHNVTLRPKESKWLAVQTRIAPCFPAAAVNVSVATYQIDTTGLESCLLNVVPLSVQVTPIKLVERSGTYDCTGAGGVTCAPGFYATSSTGPCNPCGRDLICPGGVQPNVLRCPDGTGTLSDNAFDVAQCVVLPCDTCPDASPDLYLTEDLSVYMQPAWQESIPTSQNSAQLQCTLDRADTFLCATLDEGPDRCTLNDVAIDNHGGIILAGRRAVNTGTGWIIRVDPDRIVTGQFCPYTVLIDQLPEPWSSLGGSSRSNLFYGLGDTNIFTMALLGSTATIISSESTDAFDLSGASDLVTDSQGGLYAVVKSKAYSIDLDANYIPVQGGIALVADGGIVAGAGAFCTPQQPYAVSRSTAQVYKFLNNAATFSSVGGSGRTLANKVSGAAVAPMCGRY